MKKSIILVELQNSMGSDREIAESAWTSSYNKENRETKTERDVANIVPRLIKDGHGTPIESVIFRFWIRMPIFTDRQHMTHRMASHNGLSGRYRTMPSDCFDMPCDVQTVLIKAGYAEGINMYELACTEAVISYAHSIANLKRSEASGIITNAEFKRAREILRGMLPQASMVERTTIMNLRSFANYQYQRNSDHAQPEIREVARLMLEAVEASGVAPIAIKTLKEVGWKI